MKRLFCSFLIVFLTIFTAPFADAQVKIGFKIGTNIASASIKKEMFSSGNRLGFLIGPLVDLKLPVLGLGLDFAVQYNCKYSQLDATEESGLSSGVPCFHTIEIPLNAKWTFGNESSFSAYVATGPQISWNLSDGSLKTMLKTDQYTIHSSNFSWNFGLGTTFLKNYRVGYTYNVAIGSTADINFINDMGDAIKGKLRNNTHQIFFALFF